MRKKHILFTGFMLFSLFFGAGNLIFPPQLGLESGGNFGLAITGFLITGVLLPFMAIMAIALSDQGVLSMSSQVHPIFGMIFSILIYLSIGAFYGIPRAANVAYELGLQQVYSFDGWTPLLIFSLIFFGLAYVISLNPQKMVDRIGQILTPLLLVVLSTLIIKAFLNFENIPSTAAGKYVTAPFITGFLNGYFTMDAIAALAFGIVVVNALKSQGAVSKADIAKGTLGSALIASTGLAIIYFSLGWIGNVIPQTTGLANGAEVLTLAGSLLFASSGGLLFGLIVILACLTTCVGLITACSEFFHDIYPQFAYTSYVALFTVVGLVVSTLGLNTIIALATPLLVFIYPLAIVLIILSLFQHVAGGGQLMYRLTISVTAVFALYEAAAGVGYTFNFATNWLSVVPFFEHGLGWVLPAFLAAFIGYLIDYFQGAAQR